MGHQRNLGSYGKNRIFGPKTEILGPKNRHSLFNSNHVLATTGKSCSKKKKCLCPNNQGGECHFGWFFGGRPIFRAKKPLFRPNVKNARFYRDSGPGPGPLSFWGYFFDGPDDSPEFRWNRTKIKGSCPSNVGMAKNGQKQGWAPKNDP